MPVRATTWAQTKASRQDQGLRFGKVGVGDGDSRDVKARTLRLFNRLVVS